VKTEPTSSYWTSKRLSRRHVLRGAALGVVSVGVAGCAGGSAAPAPAAVAPTTAPAPPAAAAPTTAPTPAAAKLGGKLSTFATLAETNLDPHVANGAAGGVGAMVCYSQLLTYKWGPDVKVPGFTPTGDLAESWTQPDDTTVIFKLRPNVKFHNIAPVNGRVLDAEDVRASFDRVIAKKVYAANLANVIKTEAVDPTTVKVTLDKPNADILVQIANYQMGIVAKEVADKDLAEGPTIGTGAWVFDVWDKGQRIAAKKNPDYFVKGLPYADSWESFRTADPSQVVNAFRAGSVNVIGSGMTAASGNDVQKAIPKAQTVWVPLYINPNELGLNAKTDTFRDKRVRQAISKAIDRKAIIDTIFLSRGGFNAGLLLPDVEWLLPKDEIEKLQARDLEGAKKLLKDAGKENLSFEAITTTYLQGAYVAMAELAQQNLRDIGVNMTIKSVDPLTHVQLQTSGNFTAVFGAFSGGFPNFLLYGRYYTNGPQNYVGTANADMDKLIDQQAVLTRDSAARKKLLQDLQRLIIDDATHLTLSIYEQPQMAQPEVRNFYPPGGLNTHNTMWSNLWIDK
jgi:peptide/nickel transport system substrate-binding protein